MPAIDRCEPQIIAALEKDGWQIIEKPAVIPTHDNFLFADLRAAKTIEFETQIIVIEVKCFSNSDALRDEFYRAIGQCLTYMSALALEQVQEPVYLAIPSPAYAKLEELPEIRLALEKIALDVIVCDIEREEITRWGL